MKPPIADAVAVGIVRVLVERVLGMLDVVDAVLVDGPTEPLKS